ncbi:formimidoylglutamase [soil metagenome]
MLLEVMKPLAPEIIEHFRAFPTNRWAHKVFFSEQLGADLEVFDLAIIGIEEDRNSVNNQGCANGINRIREQLYNLVVQNDNLSVVDLGNLKAGETVTDTYFGLAAIVSELLANQVVPIIIGGSHDLTLAQYHGYQNLDRKVNLVVVDEKIDLLDLEGEVTDENFLGRIFSDQPNILFGFSQLGYQSYFTDPKTVNTLEKLNFDCYRLGDVRKNMEDVEPIVRDADILSFDLTSIKMSDAPGVGLPSPHGFYGEEACQIMRYAGLSDRLTSLGIYGYNPAFDNHTQTAQLSAQMIWYFVEGFYNRKKDIPEYKSQDYLKYIVDFNEGEYELVFWKSKKSERWWLQIPKFDGKEVEQDNVNNLMSCSYNDYKQACKDELPERWLKAFKRV